nr:SpoIID/LytB domain-containing protein [Lachnoclostridium edouardi]
MKKLLAALLAMFLFPYIVTLAWTGTVEGQERKGLSQGDKKILLDRGEQTVYMDMEEYLVGVVAAQMPASYEKEALKAQAIIARTYICGQMDGKDEIQESALDLDRLEGKKLEKEWGAEHSAQYYKKIKEAVDETKGKVMEYEGELITPLFHRASAGMTRAGEEKYPYLQQAESREDTAADGYLQMISFSESDFAGRIREISDGGEVPEQDVFASIQLLERDEAGYVKEIQIGTKIYNGDDVQITLGLASPAFEFEEYGGGIRAVTKGIGHGYGMSQWGADVKAKEGWTAEEILSYFYKNIQIITV